jgi:chromosome segregation protein
VHLKSMTLKGFKSFASPTMLHFEPGVTCVVGPNGSGKSNVVDALSWVMGEQGAKSLRGGKMEDVIFAGTSGRPPLGRAEVALTIDNSDGALPIDYTEVTISRIMFRSGGSEYAINGTACRLLDVQELLSDSGIGREMHVIVGQGQLDSILHATPEDRRGFVEEAAGVLKHRKRKEKTLRKLDGLTDKMTRLHDLTGELRRQLKPLGRQAEVARRAVVIQSDARDARLRLLADDLSALETALAKEQADETALREQRQEVESQLLAGQAREAELIAESDSAAPILARNQDLWFRLSGIAQRLRAVGSVARERAHNLAAVQQGAASSVDPRDLEGQAHEHQSEHARLGQAIREQAERLTASSAARAAAESALADEERRVETSQRSAGERRERLAQLNGRAAAARSRMEARQAEIDRLQQALSDAQRRERDAGEQFQELEREVSGLGAGEVDLDAQFEISSRAVDEAAAALAELTQRESAINGERATVAARLEALRSAIRSRGGNSEHLAGHPRVLGLIRDELRIEPGWEPAVTAALGDLVEAAVVDSHETALELILHGRESQPAPSPRFVVTRMGAAAANSGGPGQSVMSVISCRQDLAVALTALLDGCVLAPDLAAATELLRDGAQRVVTQDGDLLAANLVVTSDDGETSALELAASIEAAEQRGAELAAESDRLRFTIEQARSRLAECEGQLAGSLAALHESDAAMAAVADRLGALGSGVRAARNEAQRTAADLSSAREALAADEAGTTETLADLAAAESDELDQRPLPDRREELGNTVRECRGREMEVRLALRTDEERAAGQLRRSQELLAAANRAREAQRQREHQRIRRERQQQVALAVKAAGGFAIDRADRLAMAADEIRSAGETRRAQRERELTVLRGEVRELGRTLDQLTSSVHRDEMVRTEQRLKIEQLRDRAMADFGIEGTQLIAEYGPDVVVPPSPRAPGDEEDGGPDPVSYPYDRAEQERRLKSAERALSLLGRVNPLALEEFAALEERHQFLSAQLDDLKRSRDDLLGIIREVDDRMEQVFAEAFADTAAQFERVFARLFPGGEGRLILTDPSDMLGSGVEVEARPPGKKIKRLSLLSGGERSLTAVAFLVALFKARPSPFYVLDEVEAALDDVNLGRLLEVIDELRADSQLIVITHQKRTMESADALYGVSMRGDGVSNVISQRIREPSSA